jgi:hypothetical protein
LAVVAISFAYRMIQPFYLNDDSHITYLISIILCVNIFFSLWQALSVDKWDNNGENPAYSIRMSFLRFISGKFFYIGLLGTIFGLHELFESIHAGGQGALASDQINNIIIAIKSGLETLFNPTFFGIIAYLWTKTLIWTFDFEE